MALDLKEQLKDITIEYLLKTPVAGELQNALQKVNEVLAKKEKAKEVIVTLINDEDDALKLMKIGTVLAMNICYRMAQGQNPKDFSRDDWEEIASLVVEKGIMRDPAEYTVSVFECYARYIDFCIKAQKGVISDKYLDEIYKLEEELTEKTEQFKNGAITEPNYVEDSLWICFEAMVKLLSSYMTIPLATEYGELIQAICDFTVQYGRCRMYAKEQALLQEYLDNQRILDEELQAKFNAYIVELNSEADNFGMLIDNAFASDFRTTLQNTVEMALAAGVDEKQILSSIDKVDDFFMN